MGKNHEDGVFEAVRSSVELLPTRARPALEGVPEDPERDATSLGGCEACAGGAKKALLMFDDPVMRMIMGRHLSRRGFSIGDARHAQDARYRIEYERVPELVVFECLACMGYEDGVPTSPCRRASERGSQVITVDTDSGVGSVPPPCRSPREIRVGSGFSAQKFDELLEVIGWSGGR